MTNLLFEPPFGGLRCNIQTSSIARWKASGRLLIHDNWTFFAISYGWVVISRYWSKSALFRGGVTLSANFKWKGTSHPNHCWCQKTGVFLLPHSEDPVILSSFVWIGYQRVTDRQTDGRNCRMYYSALHCKQCGRDVKTWKLDMVLTSQWFSYILSALESRWVLLMHFGAALWRDWKAQFTGASPLQCRWPASDQMNADRIW